MGYKTVDSLDADLTYSLGKRNKTTGKTDPETAEGYYLGCRLTEGGKYGPSKLHFLKTPKGNLGVWGKSDMDKKLANVQPGTMVRITTAGTRSTPRGDQHVFKVEVDADNTIEVASNIGQQASPAAYDDGGDNDNDVSPDQEDFDQDAALIAAERAAKAAKVQALLNKNRK